MDKVVVDCSTGKTTVKPFTTAEAAQQQADALLIDQAAQVIAQAQANRATIEGKLLTALSNNSTWLTNDPTGAQLSAAQTRALVQQVNGLIRIVLGVLADVTGT